jgi:hypothetical protein
MCGKYSMPFLFVDYDQGAGGEFFCSQLSLSPQCVPLESVRYSTGRSKVQDRFGQEFLKPVPRPQYQKSNPDLFELVPMHRRWILASDMYPPVYSIRIANPAADSNFWRYLKHNQLTKVLLVSQPEGKYFIGELDSLIRKTNNREFVRHVHKDMDNLTLQMLADCIEPTEQNKKLYLEQIMTRKPAPEPIGNYSLVIPYERLFTDTAWVQSQIKTVFDIDINTPWLETYRREYEAYHQPA